MFVFPILWVFRLVKKSTRTCYKRCWFFVCDPSLYKQKHGIDFYMHDVCVIFPGSWSCRCLIIMYH